MPVGGVAGIPANVAKLTSTELSANTTLYAAAN
jgi:hypothetical protein